MNKNTRIKLASKFLKFAEKSEAQIFVDIMNYVGLSDETIENIVRNVLKKHLPSPVEGYVYLQEIDLDWEWPTLWFEIDVTGNLFKYNWDINKDVAKVDAEYVERTLANDISYQVLKDIKQELMNVCKVDFDTYFSINPQRYMAIHSTPDSALEEGIVAQKWVFGVSLMGSEEFISRAFKLAEEGKFDEIFEIPPYNFPPYVQKKESIKVNKNTRAKIANELIKIAEDLLEIKSKKRNFKFSDRNNDIVINPDKWYVGFFEHGLGYVILAEFDSKEEAEQWARDYPSEAAKMYNLTPEALPVRVYSGKFLKDERVIRG